VNVSSDGGLLHGQRAVSDEELLAAARRGEASAMAHLYDRHARTMYGVAVRITRDGALAEDVVQEAFVRAWRHATRFDPARASVRTWLVAIAHHAAVDAIRRRRDDAGLPEADRPIAPAFVVPDIWGEVAGRLDASAVRDALGRIAPLQREVIELAYFGGLTQQEIAARTGTPLGTVKSRTRVGLLALRAELEAAGADDGRAR
jgi:RNA polymerase sigma factor (sigma-70 family)